MLDLAVFPTREGAVVRVHGDVDGAGAVELDRRIRSLQSRDAVVTVDLGDLGALSAPALAVLVDLAHDFRTSGTELRFLRARASIMRLLERADDVEPGESAGACDWAAAAPLDLRTSADVRTPPSLRATGTGA